VPASEQACLPEAVRVTERALRDRASVLPSAYKRTRQRDRIASSAEGSRLVVALRDCQSFNGPTRTATPMGTRSMPEKNYAAEARPGAMGKTVEMGKLETRNTGAQAIIRKCRPSDCGHRKVTIVIFDGRGSLICHRRRPVGRPMCVARYRARWATVRGGNRKLGANPEFIVRRDYQECFARLIRAFDVVAMYEFSTSSAHDEQ